VARSREGQVGMTGRAILTVEQVPIDELRPDPANPRRISDEELDSLERSLRQFGFVQPVLARGRLRRHRWPPTATRCPTPWPHCGPGDIPRREPRTSPPPQLRSRSAISFSPKPEKERSIVGLVARSARSRARSWLSQDPEILFRASLETREKAERAEDFDLDSALVFKFLDPDGYVIGQSRSRRSTR
jgi:hypothetical protein